MIKKISAIVLALVLCLSVVVLPASAGFADDYALPDGTSYAFKVELDKEYYSAGDTATVSIYFVGDENLQFGAGAVVIGVNTAIFNATDNTAATIKASSTSSDVYNSFYKASTSATWSFLTSTTNTNYKKINSNSTAEENAMYNAYVKLVIARNLNGSHDNAAVNTDGISGAELSSTSEPLVTFQLKVASDVADGTKINVGIPSGAYTSTAKQSYMYYYSDPGNATTTVGLYDTTFDAAASKVVAEVGEAYPDLTIAQGKDGIKFDMDANKNYANKISVRTKAEINAAALQAAVGGATANDDVEGYIVEAGFVFAKSSIAFSIDTAIAVAEGGSADGYTKKNVSYIKNDGTNYVYTCLIEVQDADIASADFNTFAYIALDFDKDGTADKYYYYDAANDISSKTLFNTFNDQAWAKYGWGTATDK